MQFTKKDIFANGKPENRGVVPENRSLSQSADLLSLTPAIELTGHNSNSKP